MNTKKIFINFTCKGFEGSYILLAKVLRLVENLYFYFKFFN